jgi:uncharacterized protein (DUF1800 family)
VERLARTFRRTDGDIRQVLSVLFRSDEFRCGTGRKLKRPFDFAVSSLRALSADTNGREVLPHLHRMGQAPYQWAMPNGYPDRAEAWLPSLLGRWNFALSLVADRIDGTRVALKELMRTAHAADTAQQARALQCAILGRAEAAMTRRLTAEIGLSGGSAGLAQAAALLLSSPAFQWR